MLAGLFLPGAVSENQFLVFLPASGGWWATFGIPALVEASAPSLPSSSHGLLPGSVSRGPFLSGCQPYWIRAHPEDLILN